MLSISKNPQTADLQDRLGHRIGSTLGIQLSTTQSAAVLLLCSGLPDEAAMEDLIAAAAANQGAATPAELASAIGPLVTAMQELPPQRRKQPMFDLFLSGVPLRSISRDGPPTAFETTCPTCGARVTWPATSGKDLKDRPLQCGQAHVFALSEGKFV